MRTPSNLPDSSAQVIHDEVAVLRVDNQELRVDNQGLRETIVGLKQDIMLLQRRLYGVRTERAGTVEQQLVLGDILATEATLEAALADKIAAANAAAAALYATNATNAANATNATNAANGNSDAGNKDGKAGKPSGRRDLSTSTLPRIMVELPSASLEAAGAKRIGYDQSFELLRRPTSYAVVEKRLIKYAVDVDDDTTTVRAAELPARVIARSMLHESTMAHLIVSKFSLGTPHYRLEQQVTETDAAIDRGTMSRIVEQTGNTLGATVVHAMWQDALQHGAVISTDATGAAIQPVRDKQKRQACKKGHFFVAVVDLRHVLFAYVEKHQQLVVRNLFAGFKGYLQADASSVYHLLAHGADQSETDDAQYVTLVGCWAHTRRYFFEAAQCRYAIGVEGLLRIAAMYAVDKPLWKLDPAQRLAQRQMYVRPLMDEFFAWLAQARAAVTGRNLATKALGYAHNQQAELMRVLDDPWLPLDNTRSERQLRKIVVGRKNWLFYGSDTHAEAAAAQFSLIASCQLHKIEPLLYFEEVLRLVPQWPRDRYLELSPAHWRETRKRLVAEELAAPVAHFTIPKALNGS